MKALRLTGARQRISDAMFPRCERRRQMLRLTGARRRVMPVMDAACLPLPAAAA
jgi:hypothetical protein